MALDRAGGVACQTTNTTVYAEGELVMRIGDYVSPHDHPSVPMVTGGETVYAEGMAVCRLYDLAQCGHTAEPCSTTVLAE